MNSTILNSRQSRAVQKIGDIYCPRTDSFPSFSELGVIEHIDILLAEIPEQDLKDLKMLLGILGFMPSFVIWLLIAGIEKGKDLGTPLGAIIRMIRFGFRGIIFSLYYSGLKGSQSSVSQTPMDLVGYRIQMK